MHGCCKLLVGRWKFKQAWYRFINDTIAAYKFMINFKFAFIYCGIVYNYVRKMTSVCWIDINPT